MATILLIDDDRDGLKALHAALKERGHAVDATTRGRAGVERGLGARPDLLITEWWLRERPGGLEISEALRAVHPTMHSIVLTRFATQDVRQAAEGGGFFGLLSKPADLEKIQAAIERALSTPPQPVAEQIACVEFDSTSRIVFASPAACELLRLPSANDSPHRLADVLGHRNLKTLAGHMTAWTGITTASAEPVDLEVFPMHAEAGKVRALIVPAGAEKQKTTPAMRLLIRTGTLAIRSQATSRPPPRVLLIDEDSLQRKLLCRQLDALELQFHSTGSPEQALRLLEADPSVGTVIIDYCLPDNGAERTIHAILDVRPEVKVIGTSTAFRKADFQKMGAGAFLPKPATPDALRAALAR